MKGLVAEVIVQVKALYSWLRSEFLVTVPYFIRGIHILVSTEVEMAVALRLSEGLLGPIANEKRRP